MYVNTFVMSPILGRISNFYSEPFSASFLCSYSMTLKTERVASSSVSLF